MNFYFDALYGQSKNLIKMKQQLKFNQNIQGRNVNDSNKRIILTSLQGGGCRWNQKIHSSTNCTKFLTPQALLGRGIGSTYGGMRETGLLGFFW